ERDDGLPCTDPGLLRRVEAVAMEDGLRDRPQIRLERQLAERGSIADELLERRLGETEVIPPLRLGLATMPVQDRGEQPLRLLAVVPLEPVRREPHPEG